jgi:hypothetical protein
MNEFTEDQIATVTRIDFGWMSEIPQKDSYTVILTHDQISELERLVRGYTEM